VINVLKKSGSNPALTFTIHEANTDGILQTYQTGEVLRTADPEWKKHTLIFQTPPGISEITLKIRNDAPGGTGNDLALDDIAFRACGPLIIPTIGGSSTLLAEYCQGTPDVMLKGIVSGGYVKPQFQWQIKNGDKWDDVAGQTDPETMISFTDALPGTYLYRLAVGEEANFSSVSCRIASPLLTINVLAKPNIVAVPAKLSSCPLSPVQLSASGGISYSWAPSQGLSATDIPNPIAIPAETTTYTVTVSNGTCYDTKEVKVEVYSLPYANAGEDQKISFGQSVQLKGSVSGDGVTYHWSPADFLDDPNSLTPMASPNYDITYTLIATSSFGCITGTDEVLIRVFEKLRIPNTFSPNGDGINDLWNIISVETYPGASLKVMNRYGEPVFRSRGPYYAWDGKYKNKDVPAGTYYYVIDLGNGMSKQSGWVLVVR
jgi:gliding motility-associated-like protein